MSYNRADFVHELLKGAGVDSAPLVDDEEIPALPFVVYTQTATAERQLQDFSIAFVTTFELKLYAETYADGWEKLSEIVELLISRGQSPTPGIGCIGIESFGDDDIWRPEGSEKTGFSFNLTFTLS